MTWEINNAENGKVYKKSNNYSLIIDYKVIESDF